MTEPNRLPSEVAGTFGTLRGSALHTLDSRRLVVWISAGILGFQGATPVFDLLNCTLLSWLWVRQHGIERQAAPPHQHPPDGGRAGRRHPDGVGESGASEGLSASGNRPVPIDPTAVFCEGPHSRIDTAVGQGLSILAGLALGGSARRGGDETVTQADATTLRW